MPCTKFVGVILAGQNSNFLDYEDDLLQQKKELIQSLGSQNIFVFQKDENNVHQSEPYLFSGPMGGIFSALEYSHENYKDLPLLIISMDMPFIDHAILSVLTCCGTRMQNAIQFEGYELPLFLPNTKEHRVYAKHVLTCSKDNSLKRYLNIITSSKFTTEDHDKFSISNASYKTVSA